MGTATGGTHTALPGTHIALQGYPYCPPGVQSTHNSPVLGTQMGAGRRMGTGQWDFIMGGGYMGLGRRFFSPLFFVDFLTGFMDLWVPGRRLGPCQWDLPMLTGGMDL